MISYLLPVLLMMWLTSLVWLSGGRIRLIATLPWRGGPVLLCVGFVALLLPIVPDQYAVQWFLAMSASTIALLLVNWMSSKGVRLLVVGALSNALAVLVFGAMPVSSEALSVVGARSVSPDDAKHMVSRTTPVSMLVGDVLPIPYVRLVVSSGDMLLILGACVVILEATRPSETD